MSPDQEACSMQVIEFVRRMNGRAAEKYAEIGATVEDIAIGVMFSAVDLAVAYKGSPIEAIEWARTALDVAERSILSGETRQ